MRSNRSRNTVRRHRSRVAMFAILVAVTAASLLAQGADRNIDAALVKLLAEQEVGAGRLQLTSSLCLGLERDRDPSDGFLRELRTAGLTFRKASACMKPSNGILFSVGRTRKTDAAQDTVRVEISDMAIEEGAHFATIRSRGLYTVVMDAKRAWTIVRYESLDVR